MKDSKTTFVKDFNEIVPTEDNLCVTIFDGNLEPRTYQLLDFNKESIYFGRSNENDIVINSKIVSGLHGRISYDNGYWYIEDKANYSDAESTNGIMCNNYFILEREICDGDIYRIDSEEENIKEGVLLLFSTLQSESSWKKIIKTKDKIVIGRDKSCDISLPHISVSKLHGTIEKHNNEYFIKDTNSKNGIFVNDELIHDYRKLHEKDVISITSSKIIFTNSAIYYCYYKNGISVDVNNVVIVRGKGKKKSITSRNVSLNIKPGELVGIIGGSGAGKSTILNCMCGYLRPKSGNVSINGTDLYRNFDLLKEIIGFVPQSDIVYDNLTLHDMLEYTSKLRLPKDITKSEREYAIKKAIRLVELEEKERSYIKSLSGGQRKRASIAVELLSDPNLMFLDEPASGLDPATERNLMRSLRKMADTGKTVVLVTHSTLQLKLCDKIVFMGKGGRLCFCGTYDEALRFFVVKDIVDVYSFLNENSKEYAKKYSDYRKLNKQDIVNSGKINHDSKQKKAQLPVLCERYGKLVINDRIRFFLLMLQAPLLAWLISIVANGEQFKQYEMTKSLLFSLSCSGFWIGMLNSIQEICKEKTILKREYMTGLSLNAYLLSKIIVLGFLCVIQSLLVVGVFAITIGMPDKGLIFNPFVEILVTTILTAIASTAMGLAVSSAFNNPDRAMTVAPLLLMPQILFSGLIFTVSGFTEAVSWFAVCRWSMEGYGTTSNLNNLSLKLQQQGVQIPHEVESFFEFTKDHLLFSWLVLFIFVIGFMIISRIVLSSIGKNK